MEKWIQLRHHIHQNPEVSWEEYKTQALIKQTLIESGFPEDSIKEIAKTGLIVDLYGTAAPAQNSYKVAFRADTDALPLTENNPDLPYVSVNPGAAHMCGHDGHIVFLLAAAHELIQLRDKFPSNYAIRFLFQPAEEKCEGAQAMIQEGALEGVDEIYGIHNLPLIPIGKIACMNGPMCSSGDEFNITLEGRGGHGSVPHMSSDLIGSISLIINGLAAIPTRDIDCFEYNVVTIGEIHAGQAPNAIPGTASIKGTIRCFQNSTRAKIIQRVKDIVENAAIVGKGTGVTTIFDRAAATVNHNEQAEKVRRAVGKFMEGSGQIVPFQPLPASEDFGYYLDVIPGAFILVGNGGGTGNIHSTQYDINDDMTVIAKDVWVSLAKELLNFS